LGHLAQGGVGVTGDVGQHEPVIAQKTPPSPLRHRPLLTVSPCGKPFENWPSSTGPSASGTAMLELNFPFEKAALDFQAKIFVFGFA
jgi:hypothetical protein